MPRKTNFTANGNEYFRVSATVGKTPDGKPIRKQFYGESKRAAEQKRDEYLMNINKGLSVNFDKVVFRQIFDTWFEHVLKPTVSLSTYTRYSVDYKLRIADCVLSDMKLTEIKSINIQGYYNDLLERFSINTVQNTHKLLTNFFGYCIRADLIVKNPLAAVELPQIVQDYGGYEVLSRADIDKIIEAANENPDYFIYVFAIFTGLRQGEILALTHDDIDFENDLIRVNKSVKYLMVDGEYKPVLSTTKTPAGIREVPIISTIQVPLKLHIKREKEKHLKLGIPFNNSCILFSSGMCTYREGPNVLKGLRRLYNRLGIKPTNFHCLRHTFCTLLAEMGVPLKTASTLMGHSDISVTAQIYTHVDNAEKKKGIEKLSSLFK